MTLFMWPNTKCVLPRRWLISQCHWSLRRGGRGEERRGGKEEECIRKAILSGQVRISEILK